MRGYFDTAIRKKFNQFGKGNRTIFGLCVHIIKNPAYAKHVNEINVK